MKKIYIIIPIILVIITTAFILTRGSSNIDASVVRSQEITLYKSGSCGCCGVYGNYLEKNGLDIEIKIVDDIDKIKSDAGVPSNLQSCHTIIIGDYFVEGHVPLEAIIKLIEEKPMIKGIGMEGMPSGAPGMPGSKEDTFVIYAVENDGSSTEFMRV